MATEDRKPALDLVKPGGVGRREVEVNVLVPDKPPVALWFVGFEIVEDDMDLASGMRGDDAVHEIEEFDATSALVMAGGDLDWRC